MSSLIVMSVQIPFCIIDKIIMAPIRSDAVYFVAASQKFIRWIIDHSDYMISYVYSDLLESINEQYAFLMRKNDEYILDGGKHTFTGNGPTTFSCIVARL